MTRGSIPGLLDDQTYLYYSRVAVIRAWLCGSSSHITQLLIEQGANIHTNNDYTLRLSAQNEHLEVVEFLNKREANILAKHDYALRLSASNGHFEMVKFLIKQGANIHVQDDFALRPKWLP